MDWSDEIDARGLLCPLPVLRARRRLQAMRRGAVLRLLTDDPAAAVDVPHFCAEAGHALVGRSEPNLPERIWLIRCRGAG
ncbi:MAG TPA: sulfurtransferase TusA family protein [Amaricoccus sp.]|nr:sulfurtransferase TusA family protein [Amaricoccus sp.]